MHVQVPCVGVSIGIERVFAIMEAQAIESGGLAVAGVDVLVASAGKGLTVERMKILQELWTAYVQCCVCMCKLTCMCTCMYVNVCKCKCMCACMR